MEYNEIRTIKKGLLILLVCMAAIFLDYAYICSLQNNTATGIIINEVVSFEEFNNDRTIPFDIEKEGNLNIEAKANVKNGKVSIYIMNPDNEIVFIASGLSFDENVSLNVYKGLWYYRVLCENTIDGSYSIVGELE